MGLIAGSNAGNLTLTQDIRALKEKVAGSCPGGVISDAFSQDRDYSVGDYCIYLNGLYKFIDTKPAGPWDGSKVVPVSVSAELAALNSKLNNLRAYGVVTDLNNTKLGFVEIMEYDAVTLNSPFKEGITSSGNGVVISYGGGTGLYGVQFCLCMSSSSLFVRSCANYIWGKWKSVG